jgi:hypothetical protein
MLLLPFAGCLSSPGSNDNEFESGNAWLQVEQGKEWWLSDLGIAGEWALLEVDPMVVGSTMFGIGVAFDRGELPPSRQVPSLCLATSNSTVAGFVFYLPTKHGASVSTVGVPRASIVTTLPHSLRFSLELPVDVGSSDGPAFVMVGLDDWRSHQAADVRMTARFSDDVQLRVAASGDFDCFTEVDDYPRGQYVSTASVAIVQELEAPLASDRPTLVGLVLDSEGDWEATVACSSGSGAALAPDRGATVVLFPSVAGTAVLRISGMHLAPATPSHAASALVPLPLEWATRFSGNPWVRVC